MKVVKTFVIVSIFSLSSLAMAEGESDRVYGRMIQENQRAMEQYALRNGKDSPKLVHYKYGMSQDVQRVISTTQADKTCSVSPVRMTYEDSNGKLNTLEYKVFGVNCQDGG